MRDYGLRTKKDHKARAIADILTTYPALRFILVGDSGEQDPEIYADILSRFPERIRVIYIRSIDRSPARLKAIRSSSSRSHPLAASWCWPRTASSRRRTRRPKG